MRKSWKGVMFGLALLLLAGDADAQRSGLAAACGELDDGLRMTCLVAAQAAHSAPAQVGMLAIGGNPTLGTASVRGLRLGRLPGVSATVSATLVPVRIPVLRDVQTRPNDAVSYGELSLVTPSLTGAASVALFPGFSTAPTISGLGSVDLLARASWLPLKVVDEGHFRSGSAEASWGAGVRLGLVRESFTLPGASISVMHHRHGTMNYGAICGERVASGTSSGPGYVLEQGGCLTDPFVVGRRDDLGEAAFDLGAWSTRAIVGKHLFGLGLSAGIGYDRFSSEVEVGVRGMTTGEVLPSNAYARITDVELSDSRWSVFLNGSYSVLVATFAAELGWMQGGEAIAGYPATASDFDPEEGTLFGSVGLRVAL